MNNYAFYEMKENVKAAASIATAAAVITAGTYGGSKVGHIVIDGIEDLAAAGAKHVSKAIKKKFRKKKFGFF